MTASVEELKDLHKVLVKTVTKRIVEDMEEGLPTDAATLGIAVKILANNSITADPLDKDDLNSLRETFAQKSKERKLAGSRVLTLVKEDLKEATG